MSSGQSSSGGSSSREFKIQKPAAYWNNLSTIWLTVGALEESQRRIVHPQRVPSSRRSSQTASVIIKSLRNNLPEIRRSSRQGGFDLTDLRGYPVLIAADYFHESTTPTMPTRRSENTLQASDLLSTSRTNPYSRNFEQHLEDHNIVLNPFTKPNNLPEIKERLGKRRQSLSESDFSDADFERFQDVCFTPAKEKEVSTSDFPFIEGKTSQYAAKDSLINNLTSVTGGSITRAQPNAFYGARPGDLHSTIRDTLDNRIIPCKKPSPILPNFFLELNSSSGNSEVGNRQCRHYGALGARAINSLQSYRPDRPYDEPIYDGNAYTITAWYGGGYLKLFTHHVAAPQGQGEEPKYVMAPLRSFALTDSPENFREGAAAYRNARDWAKEKRDEMIAAANVRFSEHQNNQRDGTDSVSQKDGEEEGEKGGEA